MSEYSGNPVVIHLVQRAHDGNRKVRFGDIGGAIGDYVYALALADRLGADYAGTRASLRRYLAASFVETGRLTEARDALTPAMIETPRDPAYGTRHYDDCVYGAFIDWARLALVSRDFTHDDVLTTRCRAADFVTGADCGRTDMLALRDAEFALEAGEYACAIAASVRGLRLYDMRRQRRPLSDRLGDARELLTESDMKHHFYRVIVQASLSLSDLRGAAGYLARWQRRADSEIYGSGRRRTWDVHALCAQSDFARLRKDTAGALHHARLAWIAVANYPIGSLDRIAAGERLVRGYLLAGELTAAESLLPAIQEAVHSEAPGMRYMYHCLRADIVTAKLAAAVEGGLPAPALTAPAPGAADLERVRAAQILSIACREAIDRIAPMAAALDRKFGCDWRTRDAAERAARVEMLIREVPGRVVCLRKR